jgi:hypothetical protein
MPVMFPAVVPFIVQPVVFSTRLWPPEFNVPEQSGLVGAVLLATMLLVSVREPVPPWMPPPTPAGTIAALPFTVTLCRVMFPPGPAPVSPLKMPPPAKPPKLDRLPLIVTLVRDTVAAAAALLVVPLKTPPPLRLASLSLKVTRLMVAAAPSILAMPPPSRLVRLLLTDELLRVRLPPWFRMPAPPGPATSPLRTLTPEI